MANDEKTIKQFMRQHRTEIADEGFSRRVVSNLPFDIAQDKPHRHRGMTILSMLWAIVSMAVLAWVVKQQLLLPILYDILNFAFRVVQETKFVHILLTGTLLVVFVSHQMRQEG